MAQLTPPPKMQFLDDAGNPLSGGKVWTYDLGTTTPKVTYQDKDGTTPNTNPIILDSAGRSYIWIGNAGYTFAVYNSADVLQGSGGDVTGTDELGLQGQIDDLQDEVDALDIEVNTLQTDLDSLEVDVADLEIEVDLKAPIDAPVFTGIPAAPTAAIDTDTTQLATTEFVLAQLAAFSNVINRNFFINGNETVNQRLATSWAAVTIGEYGYDRWRKESSTVKRQPVESGNYTPSTVYTISGTGVTTAQITSPASGDWDNTDLDIPIGSTYMKLEIGTIATEYLEDDVSVNLAKCQRYYYTDDLDIYVLVRINSTSNLIRAISNTFPNTMRIAPTVTYTSISGITAVTIASSESRYEIKGTGTAAATSSVVTGITADAEI